ncbi:hypothetical protein RRF57_002579 [Xylaria bambusicola]|uniref:Uncharacterized protein n=1 Tax=Xylaria bambusicola TaxID=326684 RepID=A0AAN7UJ72_9PEZI
MWTELVPPSGPGYSSQVVDQQKQQIGNVGYDIGIDKIPYVDRCLGNAMDLVPSSVSIPFQIP